MTGTPTERYAVRRLDANLSSDREEKTREELERAKEEDKKAGAKETLINKTKDVTQKAWDGLKEAAALGLKEFGKKLLLYAGILAGGFLLVTVPVILIVGAIYSSPLALLLPYSGDGSLPRIEDVTEDLYAEFEETVREVCAQGERASGQRYEIDAEAWETLSERANVWDVMSVYMVRYAQGERAIDMDAKGQKRLRGVFDDMVRYRESERTEYVTVTDEEIVRAVCGEVDQGEDEDLGDGTGETAGDGTNGSTDAGAAAAGASEGGAGYAGTVDPPSQVVATYDGGGSREIDLSNYGYYIVNGEPQVYEIVKTRIIRVSLQYAEEMAEEYEFTEEQWEQLQKLLSKTL